MLGVMIRGISLLVKRGEHVIDTALFLEKGFLKKRTLVEQTELEICFFDKEYVSYYVFHCNSKIFSIFIENELIGSLGLARREQNRS